MSSNDAPIVVVGAGPSGLAAAFRLTQAGKRVIVLEADERVGGKIRTHTEGGFVMEGGASILPSAYKNVLGIVADAGLLPDLEPSGSVVGFHRDGTIHYLDSARLVADAARTKLLSWPAKLSMLKVAADNLKIRKRLSYEDLSIAAAFDTETAEGYAKRRKLHPDVYDYMIDATLRGLLGTRGDEVSVIDFFFSFNNVIGTKLFAFRGGMSTYADRLAEKLDIRTGAKVRQVLDRGETAEVIWEDAAGVEHTETAAGCVLALWGTQVPDLVPQLDPEAASFLRRLRYTTSVNLNVALRTPPAGVPAFVVQVPRSTHEGLFGVTLEHNKGPGRVPDGKGGLGVYTMSDWAEELMELDDGEVTDRVMDAVEIVLPGVGADVEFVKVNRWYPVIVYSRPGLYKELGAFHGRRPRHGRIHLAGDYFSCSNLNTATAGGERAARELLEVLGAPA
ncbi:MAG TPA: NAD(P)/FAD-dependent oxidoreductase [Acidimicrobiia bacterium]|jgi:oxygen-dependent protoporphyrinogen oxidase|nr:NAD(P)/FAD-dependent oxidoreductase [Acidimicrobiia bacterium]